MGLLYEVIDVGSCMGWRYRFAVWVDCMGLLYEVIDVESCMGWL